MSEPKRYTISGLHPHIIESKDGFMVYYEDYARLKAEVERLKAEPDALTAYLYADTLRRDDIKTLKAQIERLTKAGDALENWIAWECESPAGTADGFRDAWEAAKEGGQS
jgi:hypothetical protein